MKKIWWGVRRLVVILALLLFLYQVWIFAHIAWWVGHNPSTSAFMDQRLVAMQHRHPNAELSHQWVPYSKISNDLKRAIIASEDAKFVDHEGFDWDGIQKAYEKKYAQKEKSSRVDPPSASSWPRTCSCPPSAPHGVRSRR